MSAAEREVRDLFKEGEACPPPESFPEGSSRYVLAKAAHKLFADEDLRAALWEILVVHPMSFFIRPPVIALHRALHDDLCQHQAE